MTLASVLSDFADAFEFIFDARESRAGGSEVGGTQLLGLLWDHLALSGAGLAAGIAVAVPLGVWLGHAHRGAFLAINVGNIGRAVPSLALIAFGLPFFGIGFTNVLVALVVLAVPPMLLNAYVAVVGVDPDAVEAARGIGMTDLQVVRKIELPLALPLIFAGVRLAAVFVVATATIAAIAGGGGLGDIIVNQASYRLEGVIGAALVVSALAFAVDLLLAGVQRALRRERGPGRWQARAAPRRGTA